MSNLAALSPLASFALLLLLFRRAWDGAGCALGWRDCWLAACVTWGVAVVVVTEVLSLFQSLSRVPLLIAWSAVASGLAIGLIRSRRNRAGSPGHPRNDRLPPGGMHPVLDRWLLAGALLPIAVTGAIAILAPPNNWDSMTYHMSRVAHWLQNRSVSHYPTSIDRQLFQGPWAEFAILQFQALTLDDRWANLIQWMSMLSSMVGVSLITAQLGGHPPTQLAAAVIVGAIPMGVLQASSTQNDYAVAFWLVCLAHYLLALTDHRRGDPGRVVPILMGASLGLALLTKGTTYLFALPFVIWCLGWTLRANISKRLPAVATAFLLALGLNIGHYARNVTTFGYFLGPPDVIRPLANEIITPSVVASNVIRNAGLHLQAPSWRANALILAGITSAHGWLRLDVTDPRTSLGGGRLEFDVPKPRFHEDLAGNGLHFILLVLSLALALIWRTREDGGRVRGYALALVVGFGLFCAYLKWQPWGSRLQLPLFVLGSALIAVIASRPAGTTPARLIAGGLCLAALPWLLLNETRPLVGQATVLNTSRVDLYFLSRPAVAGAYQSAALRVRQTRCREVGLALGLDDWEYPFWVLLDSHSAQGRSLTHVLPRSQSSTDGRPAHTAASVPCALIALDSARNVNWAAIDRAYVEKWRATPVTVFSGPVGR